MIQITREENEVWVIIDNGPLGFRFWFKYQCSDKFYAELLRIHFDKNLDEMVQQIRSDEYQRGYKDAKAKRKKATWFSPLLKHISY